MQYSEVSPDVHTLIKISAQGIADKQWRVLGARSAKEARGFVTSAIKRRVGLFTARESHREIARHRLHRVPLIGVPNAALSGPGAQVRRNRR